MLKTVILVILDILRYNSSKPKISLCPNVDILKFLFLLISSLNLILYPLSFLKIGSFIYSFIVSIVSLFNNLFCLFCGNLLNNLLLKIYSYKYLIKLWILTTEDFISIETSPSLINIKSFKGSPVVVITSSFLNSWKEKRWK